MKPIDNADFPEDFIPVILGNSLNSQSYSREFFDGYQTKSIVIAKEETWTIKHSSFVHFIQETELLENIKELVQQTDKKLLLLSTTDAGVEQIIDLTEQRVLPDQCFTFYPDMEAFSALTLKGSFSRLCSELGIPHPFTIEIDLEQQADLSAILLDGPLWIKPTHRSEWQQVEMKKRNKVYRVENIEEAQIVLDTISKSDFEGSVVIQEEIPGNDDQLVSIDIFCDNGKAIIVSAGRKLKEQKGPQTIGNALSILSGNVPSSGLEDAVKILEYTNWNGWCNIDGKIDPRTGNVVFFEANPRLGRSHYYITASGYNAVLPYVHKLREEPLETPLFIENTLYSCIPVDDVINGLSDSEMISKVVEEVNCYRVYNPLFSNDDSSTEREVVLDDVHLSQWWRD